MHVAIELPDDIGDELQARWQDLPRHTLEAVALEGYRSGALTEYLVQRMLGFKTRIQTNDFLNDHGVYYSISQAEIEREIKINQQLLNRRTRKPNSR
ncbi:MAG TPA: UPF0175 family protein [Terriglobia bacterium]|nr:UPF0175 family protein [Terriglobia bacterium]